MAHEDAPPALTTSCRERVTPRRAPRRSTRAMQTSHRGCDGEMDLSTSGLLGGRTRSGATGTPVIRRQDPEAAGDSNCLGLSSTLNQFRAPRGPMFEHRI